jgi:hypothetical protein
LIGSTSHCIFLVQLLYPLLNTHRGELKLIIVLREDMKVLGIVLQWEVFNGSLQSLGMREIIFREVSVSVDGDEIFGSGSIAEESIA